MTWMIWGIHSLGNLHMVLVHSLSEVFPALVRSESGKIGNIRGINQGKLQLTEIRF